MNNDLNTICLISLYIFVHIAVPLSMTCIFMPFYIHILQLNVSLANQITGKVVTVKEK